LPFSAGDIEATLTLKRDQFNRELDQAKADAAKFSDKPVTVKVKADAEDARKTFADVRKNADSLSRKTAVVRVRGDSTHALADFDKTAAKADQLGKKTPVVKVKADTTDADAGLDKVEAKKARVGRPVTVTVKTSTDTSGLDKLGSKMDQLTARPFSLLKTAIIGLGPAAVPVLGAVTAAALPLAAAVGSAATGLGAFGIVAKSVLTQAATASTAAQKAQTAYTTAIGKAAAQYQVASAVAQTHAQRLAAVTALRKADALAAANQALAVNAAYAGMSAQQVALSRQVGDLSAAWKATQRSVAPLVSSALVPWMKDVRAMLQFIKPLITPVAALFQQWGTQLGQSLGANAARIRSFTTAFAGRSADNLRNFGNALKFLVQGLAALARDAAPSLGGASLAVARLAASFDGWAHSAKTADSIRGFFAWAKSAAPEVGKFLSELAATVGNLVKAMALTGGGDLTVLTTVLSVISKLPPGAIAGLANAYIGLSIGLRLVSAALAINTALTWLAVAAQKALGLSAKAAAASVEEMTLAQKVSAVGSYVAGIVASVAKAVAAFAVMTATAVASAATQAAAWVAAAAVTVASFLADAAAATVAFIAENLATLGIAAAIALLVAAIVYLATHWRQVWGEVTRIAEAAWHFIYAGFGKYLLPLLGPVGLLALGAIEVARNWRHITAAFADVISWLSSHWKLILVILTGPVGLAALWIIHAWAGIHAGTVAAWDAIARFFAGWWNGEVAAVRARTAAVWRTVTVAWAHVASSTQSIWGGIRRYFESWWNQQVASFRGAVSTVSRVLSAGWNAIYGALRTAWNAIRSYFTGWWHAESAQFRSYVSGIASALLTAWHGIDSAARSVFGGLRSFFGTFWSYLKTGFGDAVRGVRNAWNGIEHAVKAPVDWVIKNVYDNLIVRFWNDVAGPVGLPKLSRLAEGGIVPGGYSRDDNQLVWMRSGEGVLQPGAVAALGGEGFIRWANRTYGDVPVTGGATGYAGGGVIPNPLPAIGAAVGGIAGAVTRGVGGFLGGLVNDVKSGIYTGLTAIGSGVIANAAKLIPGTDGVAEAMRAYPEKLWDGFAAWVTAHGPGVPTGVGGGSGAQVAAYARSFATGQGHPYVLGGASPSGWDCSGFSAWVYEHFGYFPEHQGSRHGTSESQFVDPLTQSSGNQTGALVFFNDSQFANPGHVGIALNPSAYVSAFGTATGTIVSNIGNAVGYRVPKGGFVQPGAGGAGSVGGSAGAVQALVRSMAAARGWTGALWNDLNALEMREAGWVLTARNPSSGAYGIAQGITGPSWYYQWPGGNPNTAQGQGIGLLDYIAQRYGNPAAAWAHEQAFSWYDQGGWLKPGVSMVRNDTGRPEPVLTGGQWDALTSAVAGNDLGAKLDRIAGLLASLPHATGASLGDVLNGTARAASLRARYPRNG
jgi:hypothetical protein